MARGLLIVLEGSEGVGKTTQLRLLAERLRAAGRDVVTVREPGGTAVGDEIRRILLDPASELTGRAEALLYMASRAELVERVLRPALARGDVVLLDRFFLSTYAYQVAGRGLEEEAVRQANALAAGGLVPDLTLLFSLSWEEGLRRAADRGGHDRLEQESGAFHGRVAAAFASFAEPAWQAAHPESGPVEVVDAGGDAQTVAARVAAVLAGRWPETFPPGPVSHA